MGEQERAGRRRRVGDAETPPQVRAAAEARRARRQTPEYREQLARDVAALKEEFHPKRREIADDLSAALASFRVERERQGLSLSDVMERTGIDGATLSKLERGAVANPTVGTLQTYARALGKRLVWALADAEND